MVKTRFDRQSMFLCGNFDDFAYYWVYDEMRRFVLKSRESRKVTADPQKSSPDPFSQALSRYFSVLPPAKIVALENEILSGTFEERERKYRQNKKLLETLRPLFRDFLRATNRYAQETFGMENHQKFIRQMLGINNKDFRDFLTTADKTIRKLNKEGAKVADPAKSYWSEYYLPCFLCQNKDLDLQIPDQVLELMTKYYPVLSKAKGKIDIVYRPEKETTETSNTHYDKERDRLVIRLNSGPKIHVLVALVHELSHVVSLLTHFEKHENPLELAIYQLEKEAAEVTAETLPRISAKLWQAYSINILHTFWKTFFMLEALKNPTQDLDKLYAQTYNRCFLKGRQRSNPFYLLRWELIRGPLHSLSYAIADSRVLETTLKS